MGYNGEKFMVKRLLILATFALSVASVFAQDVILKKDGSEINAKVLEITEQQVKYKDFDFQDGPTRNLNTSDVFMITYENGKREVFNKQTSEPPIPAPAPVPTPAPAPAPSEKTYNTSSNDLKREFDRIGANDNEMLAFFRRNNFTDYSNRFASACRQRRAGATLLGVGMGLIGGGIVFMAVGIEDDEDLVIAGSVLISVGEVLTIVSIPVSASAGARKRAIKNNFAKEHFGITGYTYQPKLNFGQTRNGLGLTLNF